MASIRKRNDLWQAQVRRKHAPHISKSFRRKSDALAWAREMEIEADRGFLVCDPRKLHRITLGEMLQRYQNEVSISKGAAETESIFIRNFQKLPISRRTLAAITPQDFVKYRDKRLETVSGSTVNRHLSIIQHAYEIAAKEWNLPIKENPIKQIRKPKNNDARTRRLKKGEMGALIKSGEICTNPLVKLLIILATETAMRRGELLNIQRDHVLMDSQHLQIPKTKTGVPRIIPLSDIASEIIGHRLRDMHEDETHLFPMTANALRLAWERVKKRAGVADLHFHDLRHEAISRLFERGLGVAHVAAISGHKDFRMLARYTHLGPEHTRENR